MATTDLHFVCGALQPVHRGVRFLGGAVDEDNVQIAIKDQEGHATVIKAA